MQRPMHTKTCNFLRHRCFNPIDYCISVA